MHMNSPYLFQRPYPSEYTVSRPICEVKQAWAGIVLGCESTREAPVSLALFIFFSFLNAPLHPPPPLICCCASTRTRWLRQMMRCYGDQQALSILCMACIKFGGVVQYVLSSFSLCWFLAFSSPPPSSFRFGFAVYLISY